MLGAIMDEKHKSWRKDSTQPQILFLFFIALDIDYFCSTFVF